MKAKFNLYFKILVSLGILQLILAATPTMALGKTSPQAQQKKQNWLIFDVEKVPMFEEMYIDEVDYLFVKKNTDVYVPAIQHFLRPIKKSFEVDFKHNTRLILSKLSDDAKLPTYVKTVADKRSTLHVKGKDVKTHYLEYEYAGKTKTKMICFTAVEDDGKIHTFFTQARKGSFTECQKEMEDILSHI